MLGLYFQPSKRFVQGVHEIWLQCPFRIELNPQYKKAVIHVLASVADCDNNWTYICLVLLLVQNYFGPRPGLFTTEFQLFNIFSKKFGPVQNNLDWTKQISMGSKQYWFKIVLDLQKDKQRRRQLFKSGGVRNVV